MLLANLSSMDPVSYIRHQHGGITSIRSPIRMLYQFENLGGFEPVYLRQIQKPKIPISRNVIKRRKCPESKSKILVFFILKSICLDLKL